MLISTTLTRMRLSRKSYEIKIWEEYAWLVGKLARKNFYENSKKGTIRKPNLQMFSSLLNYNGAGKVLEMWLITEHSCMPLGSWLCPTWTTFCITYDSCDLVNEWWLLKQPLLLMSCSHVWNLHRQRGSGLCSWSRLLFYYQVSVPSNVVASRKQSISGFTYQSSRYSCSLYMVPSLFFVKCWTVSV
jgi:hypothetical protein